MIITERSNVFLDFFFRRTARRLLSGWCSPVKLVSGFRDLVRRDELAIASYFLIKGKIICSLRKHLSNWKLETKTRVSGFLPNMEWSGTDSLVSNNCEPILVVEVRKRKEHNMNAPRLKPSTSNFSLPPANYILHFWTL